MGLQMLEVPARARLSGLVRIVWNTESCGIHLRVNCHAREGSQLALRLQVICRGQLPHGCMPWTMGFFLAVDHSLHGLPRAEGR